MTTLESIGEKRLLRDYILPRVNPSRDPGGAGDDCAVLPRSKGRLCWSTDRVPADLLAFKHGWIGPFELGRYLGCLNLSDLAACGSTPLGMLLTLAFPPTEHVDFVMQIVDGVLDICSEYRCPVLGGDLSSAAEMSIAATVLGDCSGLEPLLRRGAAPGDAVYCTQEIGLTPAAFRYLPSHAVDEGALRARLTRAFSACTPGFRAAVQLQKHSESGCRVTCMDNTDGLGQSLHEIAEANALSIVIEPEALPICDAAQEVAELLSDSPIDLALSPGADFQLVGTAENAQDLRGVHQIGICEEGPVGVFARKQGADVRPLRVRGWNYWESTS